MPTLYTPNTPENYSAFRRILGDDLPKTFVQWDYKQTRIKNEYLGPMASASTSKLVRTNSSSTVIRQTRTTRSRHLSGSAPKKDCAREPVTYLCSPPHDAGASPWPR